MHTCGNTKDFVQIPIPGVLQPSRADGAAFLRSYCIYIYNRTQFRLRVLKIFNGNVSIFSIQPKEYMCMFCVHLSVCLLTRIHINLHQFWSKTLRRLSSARRKLPDSDISGFVILLSRFFLCCFCWGCG